MTEAMLKETLRYLGYGRHMVDESTKAMIVEVVTELTAIVKPKSVYRTFEVNEREGIVLEIADTQIVSKSLKKYMKNCKKVILFAATLGIGPDRYLSRTSKVTMAKTVVIQAAAAALLEEYCDLEQRKIDEVLKKTGFCTMHRFSPGYGDCKIENQEMFTRILQTSKKIGLSTTQSYMLTPTKSITAYIGITDSI